MDWLQALILGIVEGVTEFLPVSSTGHLILTQRAMGIGENEANTAFAIIVQFGAILAVVGLFWKRVRSVFAGLVGRDPAGFRLGLNLVLAFVPAGVVGILFGRLIKESLFNLWVVSAAWLAGGVVILWLSRRRAGIGPGVGARLEDLTARGALLIGVVQVAAMWPGVSRSLATILGGLAVGLSLTAAVEFSFLLGVVTLCAATAKEAFSSGSMMLANLGSVPVAIGMIAAALSAVLSVRWMVGYLTRRSLAGFGWYRLILAAVTLALLATGVLQAT